MTRHGASLNGRSLSVVFGAVLILAPSTNSATAAQQDNAATDQAGAPAASVWGSRSR